MFTIAQLSREAVSTLTPELALLQAHRVLSNTSGRVALLFGQSTELYHLKTDYSLVLVTPSYGETFELTREHVLSVGYQYGQLTIGLNTWKPTTGPDTLHERFAFGAQDYFGADRNLRRELTTPVKTLTVNGKVYEGAEAIKGLLENYSYRDDFTFFGWAAASLHTTAPDFTVYVYRLADGWRQTQASAYQYLGTGHTTFGVQHTIYEHTRTGERYRVTREHNSSALCDLGKPLTLGEYRQLREIAAVPALSF